MAINPVAAVVESWQSYEQREFKAAFGAAATKGKDFIEAVIRLKALTLKKKDLTWEMVAEDLGYTADSLDARIWRYQNPAQVEIRNEARRAYTPLNSTPNSVSSRRGDDFANPPSSVKGAYIPLGLDEKGNETYALKSWTQPPPRSEAEEATAAAPACQSEEKESIEIAAMKVEPSLRLYLDDYNPEERERIMGLIYRSLRSQGYLPKKAA